MVTQTKKLTKITAFTWRTSVARAKHVYTTKFKPGIIYETATWHTPRNVRKTKQNLTNKCFKIISGAYKTTPVKILRIEIMILSMKIHLESLQTKTKIKFTNGKQTIFINKKCRKIVNLLKKRPTRIFIDTLKFQK